MSDSLPPGWEASLDPNSGRTFYINHDTKQTSWTPPVQEELPSGWSEMRDPQGRTYFIDHSTQQTTWTDPRLGRSGGDGGGNADIDTTGGSTSYPTLSSSNSGGGGGGEGGYGGGSSPSEASGWHCPSCTFLNHEAINSCDMCGTGRSGEAPSEVTTSGHSNAGGGGEVNYQQDQNDNQYHDDDEEDEETAFVAAKPEELSPTMVPDERVNECTSCNSPFTFRNRRHHCKCCGQILCAKCSSQRVQFQLAASSHADNQKERRVCDHCAQHIQANEPHCLAKYHGIMFEVAHNNINNDNDVFLAQKGVADMLAVLPNALRPSASVYEAQRAMGIIDQIEKLGGVEETLSTPLDDHGSSMAGEEWSRAFASVVEAAYNGPVDSQGIISRSALTKLMEHTGMNGQGAGDHLLEQMRQAWVSSSTVGQTMLANAIHLLVLMVGSGPGPVVDRLLELGFVRYLGDAALETDDRLQREAVKAIAGLVQGGNSAAVDALLKDNGVQALVLMLTSSNNENRAHAAGALAAALGVGVDAINSADAMRAVRVRDALISVGGAAPSVALLQADSDDVLRAGLQLCLSISDSQTEILKSAGIVPLVVALLASQNSGVQSQSVQLLYNVANSTGAGGRHEILDSGGLAMSLHLLTSASSMARRYATALCDLFSNDADGASVVMESSGALRNLVGILKAAVSSSSPAASASSDAMATCSHAAAALTNLLNQGPMEKSAVIEAGGLEALMALNSNSMGSSSGGTILSPEMVRQVVYAMYSFVSDDDLIDAVSKRIAPPTLAMKLVNMLTSPSMLMDQQTLEMLMLTVAILCGARPDDHVDALPDPTGATDGSASGGVVLASAAQTQELIGANGLPAILALLSGAQPPPVALATLRVLLAISGTARGAERLANSGGIRATVSALQQSLALGARAEPAPLHLQLRLYGITVFGSLCSAKAGGRNAMSSQTVDEMRQGLQVLRDCMTLTESGSGGPNSGTGPVKYAAVRSIRELSFNPATWDVLAAYALPTLLEQLLADSSNCNSHHDYEYLPDGSLSVGAELQMLMDIAVTVSNLAKLEKHCDMVLESGGIFALVGLLPEKSDEAVSAGIRALAALSESSARCRAAIVDLKAGNMLLQVADQRGPSSASSEYGYNEEDDINDVVGDDMMLDDAQQLAKDRRAKAAVRKGLPLAALQCLGALASDAANGNKLTSETGATDTLLRLVKHPDPAVSGEALGVLLNVSKGSDTVWEQLVLNADVQGSVALLIMGPPQVKGHAVSTIAALCEASPGQTLCESTTVLEAIPHLVQLLRPAEHLGADTSESPAVEAAAACAVLGCNAYTRAELVTAGYVDALLLLLIRERRLGRPRSATAEHTVHALDIFCQFYRQQHQQQHGEEEEVAAGQQSGYVDFWERTHQLGKRKDVVDALVIVLDAHMNGNGSTLPSGHSLEVVCTDVCHLLAHVPEGLSGAEVALLGRAARPLSLALETQGSQGSECDVVMLQQSALHAMTRCAKEDGLSHQIATAGGVRAAARILAPLVRNVGDDGADDQEGEAAANDAVDLLFETQGNTLLEAALLLARLVQSSKDRAVDDAVVSSDTVPALVALVAHTARRATASAVFASGGGDLSGDKKSADALGAALDALASLSTGGAVVRRKMVASGNVLSALCAVVTNAAALGETGCNEATATQACTALFTLNKLCVLHEHRKPVLDADVHDAILSLLTFESVKTLMAVSVAAAGRSEGQGTGAKLPQDADPVGWALELFVHLSACAGGSNGYVLRGFVANTLLELAEVAAAAGSGGMDMSSRDTNRLMWALRCVKLCGVRTVTEDDDEAVFSALLKLVGVLCQGGRSTAGDAVADDAANPDTTRVAVLSVQCLGMFGSPMLQALSGGSDHVFEVVAKAISTSLLPSVLMAALLNTAAALARNAGDVGPTAFVSYGKGALGRVLLRVARSATEGSTLAFEATELLQQLGLPATLERIVHAKPLNAAAAKLSSSPPPPPPEGGGGGRGRPPPPPSSLSSLSPSAMSPPSTSIAPSMQSTRRSMQLPQPASSAPSVASYRGQPTSSTYGGGGGVGSAASVMTSSSRPALPTFSAAGPLGPPPPATAAPKRYMLASSSPPMTHHAGGSDADKASLELAMRLQREEEQAAGRRSSGALSRPSPLPKPTSQEWKCGQCTYLNKVGVSTCEMCGKKGGGGGGGSSPPPPPPAYKSGSSGMVDLRCSGCSIKLRAPATAGWVQCPKCGVESPIAR